MSRFGNISVYQINDEIENKGNCVSAPLTMIVFFGSPLLDIIAKVDQDFLKKYDLKPDNAVRATPELEGIFTDILKFNPIMQPGGSVTNTTRVFNWVSKKSYPISFVGPIGDDNYGKLIENKFKEEDIDTHIIEVENEKTGTCAVLLTDEYRSMVTHLGASKFFSIDNLDEKLWKTIAKGEYLYLSAYLIRANFNVMEVLIKHFLENNKFIIINLAASFLCQKYPKEVTYLFENADMVFGNESEYVAFAKILNIETANRPELLDRTNQLFKSKPMRTLIMTRGSKSLFIKSGNTLEEFEVSHIDEKEIVDTNAAGDAFVGGFLAQFVRNKPIPECVKCGMWASKEIIRNHGCNFNNKLVYDYMPFIQHHKRMLFYSRVLLELLAYLIVCIKLVPHLGPKLKFVQIGSKSQVAQEVVFWSSHDVTVLKRMTIWL